MSGQNEIDTLLDMFIFETSQLIEQLENSILTSEKERCFTNDAINEIFRIMHTIKGSSAMMSFDDISKLAHSIEDLFFYIREEKPDQIDCSALSDLILESIDFIKVEIEKIKNDSKADGNSSKLIDTIIKYLSVLKQEINLTDSEKKNIFKAIIYFEEGCEMENIHAYTVIRNLKNLTDEVYYIPADIMDNDSSIEVIRREGFKILLKSNDSYEKINNFFMNTIFLKNLELIQTDNDDEFIKLASSNHVIVQESPTKEIISNEAILNEKKSNNKEIQSASTQQSIISVNVAKLDKLMDLVGEMVIAEAMVVQNPDLQGLELNNFKKSATQLNKITSEMQDIVMSIRMVPLSATFNKMHRIVRDMCKKLDKEVNLEIIGEETEVDKNIIEHISDPLMHLVRNAIDHGIEMNEERQSIGKSKTATVTLEAKNAGSDVLIIVKDDGHGLDKDKILKKARENKLLFKNENDMSEREIYNLILLPGFSTNDSVTEFSGRGVGMDVVTKNIESVGGSLSVDSIAEQGTTITLKIPLTLAIIDGMNIKVGNSLYTIPTISIKDSFRPLERDIIVDPDGNEMIMVRGECYHIRRLHELFKVNTRVTNFVEGVLIMVEQDGKVSCVFADELLGQQQVVVKALPKYIQGFKKILGLSGCTLLGDGSISLILDVAGLFHL